MNLGLDYNGVISERREQYRKLAKFFGEIGNVYVISYWDPIKSHQEFGELLGDFPCTQFFVNTEICDAPKWKTGLCENLEIDLFIDDKIIIASEIARKGILSLVAT